MSTRIILAAALLAAAVAGCGDDGTEPDPKAYLSKNVDIGVNNGLPGWSDYTDSGVWEGFDIELARWLGDDIGFTPEFKLLTTRERMTKLEEASADQTGTDIKLVISNFSMTDERRLTVDFAGAYFIDAQGFLTMRGAGVTKVEDLHMKHVCVTDGSTGQRRIGNTTLLLLEQQTHRSCVDQLVKGGVAAVSSDAALLESFARRDPRLELTGIRLGTERYGIGIPNNRPKLCAFLKERLRKFIDEAWEQKFKDTLEPVSREGRKPNSGALDNCEQPGKALAVPKAAGNRTPPATGARQGASLAARSGGRSRSRRRRQW